MNWKVPTPAAVFDVTAADGYRLIVRRHGNPCGSRLVLSHGNGLAIDAYFPFWSCLTARFDCFVYDVRNHGWNAVDGDPLKHNIPFIVDDSRRIVREIQRRFGAKTTIGVFHSLTSVVALHQATADDNLAALVLFDPPLCPPRGLPIQLQGMGCDMGARIRKRRNRFENSQDFVASLRSKWGFERMTPESLDLLARTTLRPATDAENYELCCPREYEAQITEHGFAWAMTADFAGARCPVKTIGSDPTMPYSFLPSRKPDEMPGIDYDFVPETTHLLPLEAPEICAARMVEYLEESGLAREHE